MRNLKIILIIFFVLVGCKNNPEKEDLLFEKYKAAYSDLVSNDKFLDSSSFYDVDIVINKLSNNEFRVDAIIDNPKVAMYNVQIIAEINSRGFEQFDEVIPTLGIVDQAVYHLIPYQVNKKEDFYAGLVVSGVSEKPEGDIILEVSWTDYAETQSYQEYLKFSYNIDPINEEIDEEEIEADE